MFKKVFRWLLVALVAVIVIAVIAVSSLIYSSNRKLNKTWNVEPAAITIPTDSLSIAQGMARAHVLCMDCHGEGFAGKVFFDDPKLGRIESHNLTSGKGGIGGKYSDVDWIRAIRHGIAKDGRPLVAMPADDYQNMSEEHLAEVIAYIKTLPPVDKEWQEKPEFKNITKLLAALGAFGNFVPAEIIDHQAGYPVAPLEGPTTEYGEYLVNIFGCKTCHGMPLNGGKNPDPNAPFSPNITPGGNFGKWSETEFHKAMTTGWTPDGKQMSKYMPWKATANMSDVEITAVYNYLKSLPKLETADQ
jgi:mono/diheme cytochrome c family protein